MGRRCDAADLVHHPGDYLCMNPRPVGRRSLGRPLMRQSGDMTADTIDLISVDPLVCHG